MKKGTYHHSPATIEKIRQALKGRLVSEEHRKNNSLAHQGHIPSSATREKLRRAKQGENHPNFGKPRSPVTKEKISQTKKKQTKLELGHRPGCLCCSCKSERDGGPNLGKHLDKLVRDKMSISRKLLWQDPDYIQKQMKSHECKPNRPELQLHSILNVVSPDNWIYVGDGRDKRFILSGKVPDFVHSSKKLIIELFGDYWHSEEVQGIPKEQHVRERTEHFTKHGYQTLIVWEHELKELPVLKSRILAFFLSIS